MAMTARSGQSPVGSDRAGRVLYLEAFRRVVGDLDRSVEFYCDALGFELDIADAGEQPGQRRAILSLGGEALELIARDDRPNVRFDPHLACSSCLDFQHMAIVATSMPEAMARLERFAPRRISTGGATLLPPSTGSVTAFKFRDPDGHPLELIHFPGRSGDPRWHGPCAGAATVGVDHSAIVVSDADRSIAFYEGLLGFSLASRQVNQGPAQDALDGLSDTELDVVALRAADTPTPHLELLGYRRPRPVRLDGPLASTRSDRMVWAVSGLRDIATRIEQVAPRNAIRIIEGASRRHALVLDPDGHAHVLIERDH